MSQKIDWLRIKNKYAQWAVEQIKVGNIGLEGSWEKIENIVEEYLECAKNDR